jgi:hypothetical protein
VTARAEPAGVIAQQQAHLAPGSKTVEFDLALGADAPLWDEFQPALHTLTVTLEGAGVAGESLADAKTVRFGPREVGLSGTQIAINGRPVFIRATLECCIFPRTGYPPTDIDSWKRVFGAARARPESVALSLLVSARGGF